jgi:hypothetical protein
VIRNHPLVFGLVGPFTLAGDDNPDWERTPTGYRHRECAEGVDFHQHERDPYQAPRLALCGGCGATWTRRQTGARTANTSSQVPNRWARGED